MIGQFSSARRSWTGDGLAPNRRLIVSDSNSPDLEAERVKVGIVSSCGGHLTEVRCLGPAFAGFDHFYVLNDRVLLAPEMEGRTYFVAHSERDLKFFVNLVEAWRILRQERPSVLLSTGAGVIVPFALVARCLLGIPVIYIESITRVNTPSLTGRIMARLATRTYYQWPGLARYFPGGVFGGTLV